MQTEKLSLFFLFFFSLDQKDRTTGSPNHGHASFTESREEEKLNQATLDAPLVCVSATV